MATRRTRTSRDLGNGERGLDSLDLTESYEIHPLLASEFSSIDELAVQFLKTCQTWHPRRLCACSRHNPFVRSPSSSAASKSTQTTHTRRYRQWLLTSCYGPGAATDEANVHSVWMTEHDFVDGMVSQDARNNSAWHYRFFVVYGVVDSPPLRTRDIRFSNGT